MQKLKKTRRKHKQKNRNKTEQLEEKHKNNNTGYRPRTSANKSHKIFAEVRGLDILYFCFYVFLLVVLFCLCFLCLFLCFRLVFLSCCIYNQKNTYKSTKKKQNNSKENIKTKRTSISQPEPERYFFAVGSRAGYPVFMCFVFFLRVFLFLFLFVVCFCYIFA